MKKDIDNIEEIAQEEDQLTDAEIDKLFKLPSFEEQMLFPTLKYLERMGNLKVEDFPEIDDDEFLKYVHKNHKDRDFRILAANALYY